MAWCLIKQVPGQPL